MYTDTLSWTLCCVYKMRLKQPGREADPSPSCSAGVQNACRKTSTEPVWVNFISGLIIIYISKIYFNIILPCIPIFPTSLNSSVGIAIGYGLDDRMIGFSFPAGAGNFSLRHRVQTGSRAHPASYSVDSGGSFPGLKWPGREADHSPPCSAEVNECMELYFYYPIRLYGMVLDIRWIRESHF